MIRLRSMGECVLESETGRITPLLDVLFATALYLILERDRGVRRSELTRLIWPRAAERNANHCLRQAVYRLRTLGVPIESDRSIVRLPALRVDADCLALQEHRSGVIDDALADLAGSQFLPGYAPAFSAEFSEWLDRQRDIVHAAARRVLVAGLGRARAEGEWGKVERLARGCLRLDPLNEEAVLAMAEALARSGSKARAVEVLDRYKTEIGSCGIGGLQLPAAVLSRRISQDVPLIGSHTDEIPLFGRSDDLRLLEQMFERSTQGLGSGVLIWGEPGIGKTRLLSEICSIARLRGGTYVSAAIRWTDEGRPFAAIADLVRDLLDQPGALGTSPSSLRYLRRLTDPSLAQVTPSPEAQHYHSLRASLRASLLDLVDAISSERPLLIAIDDCQWLDPESIEACSAIIDFAARHRLLLLLFSRTAGLGERRARPAGVLLHGLSALSEHASTALVRHVLERTTLRRPDHFPEWCAQYGDGNPLRLVELALRTVERDASLEPPASLRVMLSSRISQLPDGARRLLETIALLGGSSTLSRLEALLGASPVELPNALCQLEAAGLIRNVRTAISVRHDLVADLTVEELTPVVRAALHRRLASIITTEARSFQSVELAWEAAQHWREAGDDLAAADTLRTCARHCLELGLPRRAITLLEEAQDCACDSVAQRDIEGDLAHAYAILGRWNDVVRTTDRILNARGGVAKHDSVEQLHLHAQFARANYAPDLLDRLLACVRSDAEPAHRVSSAATALMLCDNMFNDQVARSIYTSVAPLLTDESIDYLTRGSVELVYRSLIGDLSAAAESARRLVSLASARSEPYAVITAHSRAAIAMYRCGNMVSAKADALAAYETSADDGALRSFCANVLLWLALLEDDLAEAHSWLAAARSGDLAVPVVRSNLAINASELFWRLGDFARSVHELEVARAAEQEGGPSSLRAILRHHSMGALLALATGDLDSALAASHSLRTYQERICGFADTDIVTAAILAVSNANGDTDAIEHTLSIFRAQRVASPSPLSPTLTRVLAELGTGPHGERVQPARQQSDERSPHRLHV